MCRIDDSLIKRVIITRTVGKIEDSPHFFKWCQISQIQEELFDVIKRINGFTVSYHFEMNMWAS